MTTTAIKQVIQHGIDLIDEYKDSELEAADLHHHLYNEDYFIIGTYQAKQFLDEYGAFDAIGVVQQYEKDNFGEVTTDLSDPEKVANMIAYIEGEAALQDCPTLQAQIDDDSRLSSVDIEQIKKELQELLAMTREQKRRHQLKKQRTTLVLAALLSLTLLAAKAQVNHSLATDIQAYHKANCELMGNSAGQKWYECPTTQYQPPTGGTQ